MNLEEAGGNRATLADGRRGGEEGKWGKMSKGVGAKLQKVVKGVKLNFRR